MRGSPGGLGASTGKATAPEQRRKQGRSDMGLGSSGEELLPASASVLCCSRSEGHRVQGTAWKEGSRSNGTLRVRLGKVQVSGVIQIPQRITVRLHETASCEFITHWAVPLLQDPARSTNPPHTACSRDGKPPGLNANGTAPPYRPNTPTRLQLIPLHTGPGSL